MPDENPIVVVTDTTWRTDAHPAQTSALVGLLFGGEQ